MDRNMSPEERLREHARLGDMALAVSELANLMHVLGYRPREFPPALERAITRQFVHYFERGVQSANAAVFELKQALRERDQRIEVLKQALAEWEGDTPKGTFAP
jgi:uncharacterized protein YbgA (DUF1722 family)